jgi:pyruvate/2-oxoglutarate dehydrogenase complex dihydrolipoamide acyltransferase (E2) component
LQNHAFLGLTHEGLRWKSSGGGVAGVTREFRLPDVGEGIHEAEIVRWLVDEGGQIEAFEPMVEIQTDKAVVELPSPVSGYIGEIHAPSGTVARVGDVLVQIDEQNPGRKLQKDNAQRHELLSASKTGDTNGVRILQDDGELGFLGSMLSRPLATPGVRYYARQKGAILEQIRGTGPKGRIRKEDIDNWLRAQGTEDAGMEWSTVRHPDRDPVHAQTSIPLQSTKIPFRGLRRATAEHVTKSAFSAPHVTAFDDCDATELVALRKRWNQHLQSPEERISYLPFLMKATVSALRAFPYFNARLHEEEQEIELIPEVHLGIAVDTPEGLLVPVIRNIDELTIREIAIEIRRLSDGAKTRSLKADELRGSTFTLTNTGPIGGLFATPILNYPEVGILAIHQIQKKPVVIDDEIVIRQVLTLSLSFDHRVIDGATSVRFMNHMKKLIENPEQLMLDMR